MSPEDFEQQLRRHPVHPIPPDWRAKILDEARAASTQSAPSTNSNIFARINQLVFSVLRPRPQAWAAMAAVWIVIFALRLSTQDGSRVLTASEPVSREVIAAVREQKLFFAELLGLCEQTDAQPPKLFSPKPRSELHHKPAVA